MDAPKVKFPGFNKINKILSGVEGDTEIKLFFVFVDFIREIIFLVFCIKQILLQIHRKIHFVHEVLLIFR